MRSRRVDGIILAAGAATRFGGGKLLAPFKGAPLVGWAVQNALMTPIDRCVVVIGAQADAVGSVIAELGDDRIDVVEAVDWHSGLSASLRAGVGALPDDSVGALIFLGDMPNVSPRHGALLASALLDGADGAEMTSDGRPAHPVGFSSRLYADLMNLRGDRGGRHLLIDRPGVRRFETDDAGALTDIDTRADLEALRRVADTP